MFPVRVKSRDGVAVFGLPRGQQAVPFSRRKRESPNDIDRKTGRYIGNFMKIRVGL
jgi:hypothetical protein